MSKLPHTISGTSHIDKRGRLLFFNNFDMTSVKRFYLISSHKSLVTRHQSVRTWQGHKIEEKYFFVSQGAFCVGLVKIDDWQNPSEDLPVEQYRLDADSLKILHIPAGYANGIKVLRTNSQMIVFSTLSLDESKKDDHRFSPSLWLDWDKD